MPYTARFALADVLHPHLTIAASTAPDPFIQGRYAGFMAVAGVTVFELAIKDIFSEFSEKKHSTFGAFARAFFDRINGRIKIRAIIEDYISKYGDKYVKRFEKKLAKKEREILAGNKVSLKASYGNLITWRNGFAHEGLVPANATLAEVIRSYELGKEVLHCLAESMNR